MSTEQALHKALAKMGCNISLGAARILVEEEYETVADLQANPCSLALFLGMPGMKSKSANALAIAFSGATNAPKTGGTNDSLRSLMDNDPDYFTWRKIEHLTPEMIKRLVDDFFVDTDNKRSPGYAFMEAIASGSRRDPVAKLQGQVNKEGTLKMVPLLITGKAKFVRGYFVVNPTEKYIPVSLADMNIVLSKIDPLDPSGGYLTEGTGLGFRGVRYYNDSQTRYVLPKKVQQFLVLAYECGELTQEKSVKIADQIRGKEAGTTIDDVRWDLEQTYEHVDTHADVTMPDLDGDQKVTPRRYQRQPTIQQPPRRERRQTGNSVQLRKGDPGTPIRMVYNLAKYYSTSELQTLCFDIGVDYEDLGGTGKSGKAREIVQFATRRGRMNDIKMYISETRPQAEQ